MNAFGIAYRHIARPTSRRFHRSRMPRQLRSRCSRLCNRLCWCNPRKHKLHKLRRHSHICGCDGAACEACEPALHSISPPAQAGFQCCCILKFLWHCGGGYLSLPIYCLVSMWECLQLKLQVAAYSKFFQRIAGNIAVQGHKEAWSDWKLILTTAAATFDTWISLQMAVTCALLFQLSWCTECQVNWEGSGMSKPPTPSFLEFALTIIINS